jgi:hypothetical protein
VFKTSKGSDQDFNYEIDWDKIKTTEDIILFLKATGHKRVIMTKEAAESNNIMHLVKRNAYNQH